MKAGAAGLGVLAAASTGAAKAAAPARRVRVAVVQQETVPGDVENNMARALAHAREALAGGADIILFHEELLVGYTENLRELAEEPDGPSSRRFQSLLKGSDSLILWGLTERDNGKNYIAATLVGSEGVLANYRKTHLWWKADGLRHEPSWYEAGESLVTFELGGHRCGVMICYDGDFPEMTRAYANLGCSMLFWLNNRGSRGHSEVTNLASTNSMIIAASCCCGNNELGYTCRGGSNITDHDGALLAEIWDREGVIYADVSPGEVHRARAENPWYMGRRGGFYCRYE